MFKYNIYHSSILVWIPGSQTEKQYSVEEKPKQMSGETYKMWVVV